MNHHSSGLHEKIFRAPDEKFGFQRALSALGGVSQSFVEKLR